MAQQTRMISVEGMTCTHCVNSVHDVVGKVDGVESVAVSLEFNRATVTFDSDKVSIDQIIATIEEAGFDASIATA